MDITKAFLVKPANGVTILNLYLGLRRQAGARHSVLSCVGATKKPYVNLDGQPLLRTEDAARSLCQAGIKRLSLDISSDEAVEKQAGLLSDIFIDLKPPLAGDRPSFVSGSFCPAPWEDSSDEAFFPFAKLPRQVVPIPRMFAAVNEPDRAWSIIREAIPIAPGVLAGAWFREAPESDPEVFCRFLESFQRQSLLADFALPSRTLPGRLIMNNQCFIVSATLGLVLQGLGLHPILLRFVLPQAEDEHDFNHVCLGLKFHGRIFLLDYTASQYITQPVFPYFNSWLGYRQPDTLEGEENLDPFFAPLDWVLANSQHFAYHHQLKGATDFDLRDQRPNVWKSLIRNQQGRANNMIIMLAK